MRIDLQNNVLSIVSRVPTSNLPVVIKDEEGNDVYAFCKGSTPSLTDYQFKGNTEVGGCLSYQVIVDSSFDLEKFMADNKIALVTAYKYEVEAIELAAKQAEEDAEMDSILASLIGTVVQ